MCYLKINYSFKVTEIHLEKKNELLFSPAAKMWNISSTEKENFQLFLQNTSLLSFRSTEHKNGKKSKINKHEKLFLFLFEQVVATMTCWNSLQVLCFHSHRTMTSKQKARVGLFWWAVSVGPVLQPVFHWLGARSLENLLKLLCRQMSDEHYPGNYLEHLYNKREHKKNKSFFFHYLNGFKSSSLPGFFVVFLKIKHAS